MNKKGLLLIIVLFVTLLFIAGCETLSLNTKYDYLVLVNKYSKLPNDWEPNVRLVTTKNAWKEDIQVEEKAYEKYKELKEALKEEGVTIELDSAYRSVEEQQNLWDEWSKDPEKGIEYVKKYVAVPGYSEHHTGLAIDICLKKDGKLVYDNDDMIADRETFAKIHKKLADYGFILRYLEGRDEITGYAYEPWHLRYIDNVEIAKEIMKKDITFEEYLDSIKDVKGTESAAKYQIMKYMKSYLEESYGDKITDSRYNVTKVYTVEEEKEDPTLKNIKFGEKDIAFTIEYDLKPAKEELVNDIAATAGVYDSDTGWIKNYSGVGVLRYDKKKKNYYIDNFGTSF